MLSDPLKVIAAQIRNNIIRLVLEEVKEHDEFSQEDTLALISYINNQSDEELLVLALNDWMNLNELSETILSTLKLQYKSLTDLPF